MSSFARIATCVVSLFIGCGLVLEFAGGQDADGGGKVKKEKAPKGDKPDKGDKGPKGEKGDKGNPEDKAVYKTADKATRPSESERDKWLKELNKAYPGHVTPGETRADFEQWFDLLAAGGADWRRENAPIKQVAELFDRAAVRLDLDGTEWLRRDEFLRYAARFLAPGNSPPWKSVDPVAEADKVFRHLDRDGSGFLEANEWPDRLRVVADRFDRDRDGRISLDEYRDYFHGRVIAVIEAGSETPLPRSPAAPPLQPIDLIPGPIRYGRLPSGLPAWFVELDTDEDGQISLYEWRQAGRPMVEFFEMDLNGDGLLPPAEYFRYQRFVRTGIIGVLEGR